jgi:hypothetical protein
MVRALTGVHLAVYRLRPISYTGNHVFHRYARTSFPFNFCNALGTPVDSVLKLLHLWFCADIPVAEPTSQASAVMDVPSVTAGGPYNPESQIGSPVNCFKSQPAQGFLDVQDSLAVE